MCDWPSSKTDSDVSMEIYVPDGANETTKLCTTNVLDYSYTDDWQTGKISRYCGSKFLGECLGKDIGDGFIVVLRLKTPFYRFGQKDYLCLEWIKHVKEGLSPHQSISHGWSMDTKDPDSIYTNFV